MRSPESLPSVGSFRLVKILAFLLFQTSMLSCDVSTPPYSQFFAQLIAPDTFRRLHQSIKNPLRELLPLLTLEDNPPAQAMHIGVLAPGKRTCLDLHNTSKARGERDVACVNEQKTGVLFAAALAMAALACDTSDVSRATLQAAAADIGQAFQMLDDLEDGSQTLTIATKDHYKDVGKSTMVSLLGWEAVQQRMPKHLDDAVLHLRKALPDDDQMVEFTLQACGRQSGKFELTTADMNPNRFQMRSMQHMATA